MDFLVVGDKYPMVQLFCLPETGQDRFQRLFSSPITTGEAGLFTSADHAVEPPNGERFYYYPHEYGDEADEVASREAFNLENAQQAAAIL